MSTEEKLKEAQELMDSATGSIRTLQRVIDRVNLEITTLSKKLVEENKPELRHGDYGYDKDGGFRIMISHDFKLYTAGDGCLHDANLGCYDLVVVLGNIFDDLESMQEDVEEFVICDEESDEPIYVQLVDAGSIKLSLPSGSTIVVYKKEVEQFVLKLRQMEATLKRRHK